MSRIALALALATFAAAPAFAELPHWYAGVAGGSSRTGHELVSNRESTFVNVISASSDFDATDSAWKVFGGWRYDETIGLEASYVDLGKSHLVTHTVSGAHLPGSIDIHRKITAFVLDGVVAAPIGARFRVFGRVGAAHTRLRADASLDGELVFTDAPEVRARSVTRAEIVPHFGAGAEWRWRPDAALRLEWERFQDVGKAFHPGGEGTTGEASTDLVSLGVEVRF